MQFRELALRRGESLPTVIVFQRDCKRITPNQMSFPEPVRVRACLPLSQTQVITGCAIRPKYSGLGQTF